MNNDTKKTTDTAKLIHTGSANLEILNMYTNIQFWKEILQYLLEKPERLEINDLNEYICQPL